MENTKSPYELELDIEKFMIDNGLLDDWSYYQDLKIRRLTLNSDISQASVAPIISQIMRYNRDDKGTTPELRRPIVLYLASNGGEVDSGLGLIDIITASKTPVYTVNIGYQYSMGFLIGIAGHKRYTLPSARFLLHDGYTSVSNTGAKVVDQIKFNERSEERIKAFVLSRGKVTEEEYDNQSRKEWYMFAEEAKEHGFTDYIIGVDCDIDEIM